MDASPARCERPIFIVGTERSGSNLLRLILNAHSHIGIPHPPHIFHYFAPLESRYGDLAAPTAFARLVRDVLRLVRVHIYPWNGPLDAARIMEEAAPRDLLGVFRALYDHWLEATGKARWGCKSTFMLHHVDRVLAHLPAARFIWLVRDPRDVAASSKQSVFNPYHPRFTAELWTRQQDLGLALRARLGEGVFYTVHYEDLVGAPEPTVRKICGFLEEGYQERMLRFFETDEAAISAALSWDWRNTGLPILGNSDRHRQELDGDELRCVETVAGETMRTLGYLPCGAAGAPLPSWARCVRRELALRLREESRSLWRSRNHWQRWRRALVVASIRSRA